MGSPQSNTRPWATSPCGFRTRTRKRYQSGSEAADADAVQVTTVPTGAGDGTDGDNASVICAAPCGIVEVQSFLPVAVRNR